MKTKRLALSIALSLLLIATAVFLPIPAKVNADGIDTDTIRPVITDIRILNTTVFRPGVVNVEVDVVAEQLPAEVIVGFYHYRDGDGDTEGSLVGTIEGKYTGTHTITADIASDDPVGEYVLSITIRDQNNSVSYSLSKGNLPGGEKSILVVDEFDYAGTYNLDAPSLTKGLKDMGVGKAMKVYADSSATRILKKEHLDAIKGQDKTIIVDIYPAKWVIKGTNLTGTTKDINVSSIRMGNIYKGVDTICTKYITEDNVSYREEVVAPENMLEVIIASNGQLPGKMQIRLQIPFGLSNIDEDNRNKPYVYFVKGTNLAYEGKADDVIWGGGGDNWFYMTVTHNSTFVFSNSNKLNGLLWGTVKIKTKTYFLNFHLNKGKVAKKIKVWGRTMKKGAKNISSIWKTFTYRYVSRLPESYYPPLPILTRKGYKFLGWYSGAKKVTAKTKISKTITTLKAKWKKNKKAK